LGRVPIVLKRLKNANNLIEIYCGCLTRLGKQGPETAFEREFDLSKCKNDASLLTRKTNTVDLSVVRAIHTRYTDGLTQVAYQCRRGINFPHRQRLI